MSQDTFTLDSPSHKTHKRLQCGVTGKYPILAPKKLSIARGMYIKQGDTILLLKLIIKKNNKEDRINPRVD